MFTLQVAIDGFMILVRETFGNSCHYNIMSVSVHCLDNKTQCSFYEIHLYIVVICFCQYEIK